MYAYQGFGGYYSGSGASAINSYRFIKEETFHLCAMIRLLT